MPDRTHRLIGALFAVSLVSVAGCGSASNPADSYKSTPPTTIASQAHAALNATTSLHVAGTVQFGSDSVTVDLASDLTGAMTGTATIDGATVQIVGTGGSGGAVYVQGGQDFWAKVAPQYATRLAGKWVADLPALPANLRQLTLPKLIQNENRYAWEKEQPRLIGTGSVNGTPTVQIGVTDGSGGATEVLDVAATDPHRVLKEFEGSVFTLTFDRFGEPVTAPAPSASDVVDFTKVIAQN